MHTLPPHSGSHPKIVTRTELASRREALRAAGKAVVQCHGCFDIVHPGHVRHLQQARSMGDALIVSLTADEHVGKGDGRPLFNESLRAENLAALDCVDLVCVNTEPTAVGLLDEVRPDMYVKGREYESNNDPRFAAEREAVERHGGSVVFSSGDIVFSSTAIVRQMEADRDPSAGKLDRLRASGYIDPERARRTLALARGAQVVVVGEVILDTYVHCDQPQVASESPVLSLRPLDRMTSDGGAAVIARHLAALGAAPTLVTALPRTTEAQALRERLEQEGVRVEAVPCETPLLEKQRFLVGTQKVMKLDLVRPVTLGASVQGEMRALARNAAQGAQAAILADFGNGLLTQRLLGSLIGTLRPLVPTLSGDVSGRRAALTRMESMDLLCPTEQELRAAMGDFDNSLNAVVAEFAERTHVGHCLVTLGAEGLIAFDRLAEPSDNADGSRTQVAGEHVPALAEHAIDTLGCGDALLSVATLARIAGAPIMESAFLGSVAAAASASRLGNDAVGLEAVVAGVQRLAEARLTVATRPLHSLIAR